MDFSPSIYEHAAKVIHKSPWEVSRSEELMYRSHARAYQLYGHSPIVVGIDIYNLEVEAYGAQIGPPAGNDIPSIKEPIGDKVEDIIHLNHFNPEQEGRIPLIVKAGLRLKQELPEVDIRIPVSGAFSIASNLIGMENLLIEAMMNPDLTKQALFHLVEGQKQFCQYIKNNGLDISFFESAASPPLISPQTFSDVVLPSLNLMIKTAENIFRHPVACIIGGDTASIVDEIMETGTGYIICPYETDQEKFMKKMEKYPDVLVRINMNPNILITNRFELVVEEVERVMKLAEKRENVNIGTGVVPYETESEMLLKTKAYVLSK